MDRMVAWRRDEGADVWEYITGTVKANRDEVHLQVTDGRSVFDAEMDDDALRLLRSSSLATAWWGGADVMHVYLAIPPLRQLVIALLFRLRGASIVFSPMTFLTDDFRVRSWTHARPGLWTWGKPLAVGLLRLAWRFLAQTFVCVSLHEVQSSHFPPKQCVIVPWPRPRTPILDKGQSRISRVGDPANLPIAFVSRMDIVRKGIDRLCAWLQTCASSLPRPAVLLLAPDNGHATPTVHRLAREGIIDWDPETHGSQLVGRLRTCRGVMLLSRFEGQPRSLREALCLGLPVVCTSAANMDEIVAILGGGRIVSGDDAAEITAAYEAITTLEPSASRARALLDGVPIGDFMLSVYRAASVQRLPAERDYYERFRRLQSTGLTANGG